MLARLLTTAMVAPVLAMEAWCSAGVVANACGAGLVAPSTVIEMAIPRRPERRPGGAHRAAGPLEPR